MSEGSTFVLGVDLDGVCADFYAGLRHIAAEWLGVPIEQLTPEVSYGLPEWGIAQEQYEDLHRFAVLHRKLFVNLEPIAGAAATIRRLSERGIRIRLITHRLFIKHIHEETIRQTVSWLDHHDVRYWDLCFMADKGAVGADLYIEDAPKNVKELRALGHPTIVFTNSTNRDLDGLRADDWREAEKLVLEEFGKWRQSSGKRVA
jgi:5'(3')-deoxyribonucleotidase